uniref:Uncharacterized protein n=1 Tax=Chromera velia CCMP2878 TaxID=1169474 RepID=A0A0G4ICF4_9ALVE|eukprot:Cvel_13016.t1-p1 / transcript=Cvel_13016.t1 / gene=Cvel_13016 / organism=Chromera_velia_CCMP2878 / gene_product=hypothetical protein / transcript_product=hypothetical protein / location=Cvel_scaffold873:50914-55165(-) / protein_length=720 / sequence_SO=supercontig / SO=protein_coding / is_pseudo=false
MKIIAVLPFCLALVSSSQQSVENPHPAGPSLSPPSPSDPSPTPETVPPTPPSTPTPEEAVPEVGTVPAEVGNEKQNYGYVNGAWFDRRRQNYFNGGFTQNYNTWNGNNFGHIGTVFGGGYRGRRMQDAAPASGTPETAPPTDTPVQAKQQEVGVVSPEEVEARNVPAVEESNEKQNYGYVNGPWFDQRRQNYFNGGFTQNYNTWNGHNFGHIGTVFGGGYRGRRMQEEGGSRAAAEPVANATPETPHSHTDEDTTKQNYGYVAGPYIPQRTATFYNGGVTATTNAWNGRNFGTIGDNFVPAGATVTRDPITGQRTGVAHSTISIPAPSTTIVETPAVVSAPSVSVPPATPVSSTPSNGSLATPPTPAAPSIPISVPTTTYRYYRTPSGLTYTVPVTLPTYTYPFYSTVGRYSTGNPALDAAGYARGMAALNRVFGTGRPVSIPAVSQIPVQSAPGNSVLNTGVHQGAFVQTGTTNYGLSAASAPVSSRTVTGNFYGSTPTVFGAGGFFGRRRLQGDSTSSPSPTGDEQVPPTPPTTTTPEQAVPEVGTVPEEESNEKQNYGYVNGPWFDQRRQNYFNGGFTQNYNTWNGNNFGHIGTVFGGGYRGRRMQDAAPASGTPETAPPTDTPVQAEQQEVGVVSPEEVEARDAPAVEEGDEKQNYGYVNGPWFDQRRQNFFNGGFTQNYNTWNGHNFGSIGTVFGGGYRGRRMLEKNAAAAGLKK